MLFINSNVIRQGIGRMLLLHAINDLGITRVDVNEQNEQAIGFMSILVLRRIRDLNLMG
jgi:putative acetyltransferase